MGGEMKTKQFELTGKCNLKCRFCYNQMFMPQWGELPEEFVIEKAGKENIIFIGGGEPALYKRVYDLVEKLIESKNRVVLSTNGVVYREFPVSELFGLQISLPAINRDLYREITGFDFVERVKANILRYKEKHRTHINMPVYHENINEMPDIAQFCRQNELPLVVSQLMSVNALIPLESNIVKRKCIETALSTGADIRFTENRIMPYKMEEYFTPCCT